MAGSALLIDLQAPDPAFRRCRETIQHGGVIAYPTDTLYGLGADPRNADAVRRLFRVKGRSEGQPILLLLADAGMVGQWAAAIPPQAALLMERFWPGPLTIVFRAKESVLPELTAGTGTIGLRVPANDLVLALLRMLGGALTATSANRSGMPAPRSAAEAAAAVGGLVDCILDDGQTREGSPSTVVDCTRGDVRVVREGEIAAKDILKAVAGYGGERIIA